MQFPHKLCGRDPRHILPLPGAQADWKDTTGILRGSRVRHRNLESKVTRVPTHPYPPAPFLSPPFPRTLAETLTRTHAYMEAVNGTGHRIHVMYESEQLLDAERMRMMVWEPVSLHDACGDSRIQVPEHTTLQRGVVVMSSPECSTSADRSHHPSRPPQQ